MVCTCAAYVRAQLLGPYCAKFVCNVILWHQLCPRSQKYLQNQS